MSVDHEVLVVAFGPVQGFVAAARKTRDLERGSLLLSELALAAAAAVAFATHAGVVTLVVPAIAAGGSTSGLSNKLVLLIRGGTAAAVGKLARDAALARLREIRAQALDPLQPGLIDHARSNAQVERFLETAWASAPLRGDGFGSARERAERALDGRKALRDFPPYFGRGNRTKASVDGVLEGIIDDAADLRKRRGPGTLKEGEQVDAMGLIRRLWKPAPLADVPSTAGVAVAPWVRMVKATHGGDGALQQVDQARKALVEAIKAAASGEADFEVFDKDYSWLLEEKEIRGREIRRFFDNQVPDAVRSALGDFDGAVDQLLRDQLTRPTPYYAVVSADGDGIGSAFGALREDHRHAEASRRLAAFADDVRKLGVKHGAHVAYAGGDDLLALVSLDDALAFVADVREAFDKVAPAFLEAPTLSAGVAIVHHNERLTLAVELARSAERAAKDERDRLAVLLSKRSGGDLQVVLRFSDNPTARIEQVVRALSTGEVARGFAHELARVAPDLQYVSRTAALAEITRILARKRSQGGTPIDEATIARLLALTGVDSSQPGEAFVEACGRLSAFLRIALHLAENVQPRAHPSPPAAEGAA